MATPANEERPRVSPDGRWVAYTSGESGRPEAFVRSLATPTGRQRVSSTGALCVVWAPDGRTLYFNSFPDRGLWAAPVTTTPTLTVGKPTRLFATDGYVSAFDISPDGTQFVMVKRGPLSPHDRVELVQNALAAVPGAR